MRHVLGSVVLTAALALTAGCGDDSSGTADDAPSSSAASSAPSSAPPPSAAPTTTPTEASSSSAPAYRVVELVTATAAGGTVGDAAALTDEAAATAFISQFDEGKMTDRLQQLFTTTEAPEGTVQYAAVVAVGCDVPTKVAVVETADGIRVEGRPVKTETTECFAPMTTVAFLVVPRSAVGLT